MRMAEAGNMGDMGIMMLYGTVMLGLCIAGIVLLITKRKSWEFYLAPEELPAGLKIRTAYANPGVPTVDCDAYRLDAVRMTVIAGPREASREISQIA